MTTETRSQLFLTSKYIKTRSFLFEKFSFGTHAFGKYVLVTIYDKLQTPVEAKLCENLKV